MRRSALILLPLVVGCASAGAMDLHRAALETAPQAQPRTDLTEWHVHLDTRDRRLGAYTIVLHYNATVARIHEVRSCTVRRFKGAPEYDPSSFATGTTRVTSLDAFPGNAPDSEYHLLTVIFERIATGTLEARAELEKAYDQNDKAVRARITQPTFTYAFP